MAKPYSIAATIAVLFTIALASCAPLTPTAPPAVTPATLTPSSLTITTAGSATSTGDVLLMVSAYDGADRAMFGVSVALSTTAGTLNHRTISTGQNGQAQAVLNTTTNATVTATAGGLTATTRAQAFTSTQPLPVSISASTLAPNKGDGVTFNAAVTGGAAPLVYSWTFGDGGTADGQTPAHRFFSDGAKAVNVTVTDADKRTGSASTTISVQPDPIVVLPPTPVAPSLAAALTCTPMTSTGAVVTPCNVAVTFGGSPVLSTAITNVDWDWGDGTIVNGNTAVPVNAHDYGSPGVFVVTATVTATIAGAPQTATATKTLTIP